MDLPQLIEVRSKEGFILKRKILLQVLKNSAICKLTVGYIVAFAVIAFLIFLFEPTIGTYGNALWYCFVSCSTIGFGDMVVTAFFAKVLTVILYIYTVVIIALVTAVITQYFLEVAKHRRDESVSLFLYDLEHLPDLPKERLEQISQKVRTLHGK